MGSPSATAPAVRLDRATVRYGSRLVWADLAVELAAGEFLAVLGPNGAGKTTLLRVLLGLEGLSAGSVEVGGRPPRRGSSRIGYIPQQRAFDHDIPIRGRDLVQFGLDGHRWGLPLGARRSRGPVAAAIEAVGASAYAGAPIGRLSGGEQQRLRIAQALLGDPDVLLCDEPLLSLDLSHQRAVCRLIDERRQADHTAVVFVTHEINPILAYVDRVLYFAAGRWAIGTPDEVLTGPSLSDLYGTPVEVVRVAGRLIVVGADPAMADGTDGHHHLPGAHLRAPRAN